MAQVNIVFLIDVNGIPKECPGNPLVSSIDKDESLELFKEDGGGGGGEQRLAQPTSSSAAAGQDGGEEFLEWLKEFVLVTLHREAFDGGDFDYSKVQWAFKFFNSSQHVDFRDCRGFLPFDNESFTNFESQLNQRMKNSGGGGVEMMDAYSQMESSKVKYLSDAIKIITGGLPWTEAANLSKSFSGGGMLMMEESLVVKNSVYTLFRVPRTERQLEQFSGVQGNGSTKDFMGVLLPAAFSSTFHHKLRIQLNFVDMWTAPENRNHCFDREWSGNYPKQIVKCLHYLGNGKIVSVPFGELASLKNIPKMMGLVSYMSLLRGRLEQVDKLGKTENIPQCVQKLAPPPLVQIQKISPPVDLDTSSLTITKSYKSASVLEASFKMEGNYQQQKKVLRPFRMSVGGGEGYGGAREEDDGEGDYGGYQRRLSDHRGERKRKRWEYDREEEYEQQQQERRRFSGGGRRILEEDDGDSVEVDSQCERDQRLENWVKDGVFSKKGGGGGGKGKHLVGPPTHQPTSTTVVPMSRPPGFHHVFHEPAPKMAAGGGHRNKKMLAIVERKKIKANIALESKRRSGGGGGGGGVELDMKRITEKQEKELSAIKRRLKTYLEGELDFEEEEHEDPLNWMKRFKKEMGNFKDMILQEEEPCLVALAQALVNCASVKFNPQRLSLIRRALGAGYTAKDLLEEILLEEFTHLNRRIIQAHEKKGVSPAGGGGGGLQQKLQKILTFRETELQIILRLEIAWCFFIEPDEEATEELLHEIVRLLQIIAAYRTEPPIDYFVNSVLLPTYSQSSKFMRTLYKKMNIPLPSQLAMDGSPVPSSSRRDDDSSMISSTSSANLYPEDSASQLNSHYSRHHHYSSRHHHQQQYKRHRASPSAQAKRKGGGSGGKNKAKRQIMVATTSNPKLPSSHFLREDDRQFHRKSSSGGGLAANVKISPKRVRRNLFDVQKKDKKDSKTLLTLAFSATSGGGRLAGQPFKSPKLHKSPMRSPSAFFRAARSRKQLSLSQNSGDKQFGSPKMSDDVLCPESPATPGDRMSMASRYAPSTNSKGSSDRHRVIQESPEVQKNEFDNRPMGRVASCSFYSTNQPKSRAWEKSETQLMAARIKESVDLRSQQLSMDDLEFIAPKCSSAPYSAAKSDRQSCPDTPKTNLSYCADSYTERLGEGDGDRDGGGSSPIPESDFATGPAPGLDNPNIQALITSRSIFPNILASSGNFEEDAAQDNNPPTPVKGTTGHPNTVTSPSLSNLQTPSKRVQFNLNENLVNTPSSEARRSSTPGTTPKSILKDHASAPALTTFTAALTPAFDSTV